MTLAKRLNPATVLKENKMKEIKDKYGNVMAEPYKCKICNGYEDAKRWNHMNLPEQGICFSCHFWSEHAANAADPRSVRIGGAHFWLGKEDPEIQFRGFGGRQFVIHFHDGRKVTTTNLWSQSEIPEVWQKVLPDNAVWGDAPKCKWVKIGNMQFLSDNGK